ncbi:protein Jumonji-like [Ornithodoros turicata]
MKSAFKERQLSECASGGGAQQRPKRNASTKNLGTTNGLHWMEEKDLKKALYASLNETKKARSVDENASEDSQEQSIKTMSNSSTSSKTMNDADTKRVRVHAQRKFAQGSNPSSPMPTPVKLMSGAGRETRESVGTPSDFLPRGRRPKTEDFLTFLCLRGTPVLPPTLDFMGVARNCSGSERSSSSDTEAAWNSMDSRDRERGNGHSSSVASSATSVDSKSAAQKVNKQRLPMRPLADRGEDNRRSSSDNRSARSTSRPKPSQDRKKAAGKLPEMCSRENVPASKFQRPQSAAHAIREKYKHQRLVKTRSDKVAIHSGRRELRSRTIIDTTKSLPQEKRRQQGHTRTDAAKHKASLSKDLPDLKSRGSLHSELCVQLTRLSPRSVASMGLRNVTSSRWKGKAVGITPHLRKAKLVPPIVDYDSESERESSPLSTRMSPRLSSRELKKPADVMVRRRLRSVVGVDGGAKKTVARSTAIRACTTRIVAKKLLSTAKLRTSCGSHKVPMKLPVFRRKTRSLGPVKDHPLVLPVPTKRRFSHIAKKAQKEEKVTAKRSSDGISKLKGAESSPSRRTAATRREHHSCKMSTRGKALDDHCLKPKGVLTRRQSETAADSLSREVVAKRQTRRMSQDAANNGTVKKVLKQGVPDTKSAARTGVRNKNQRLLQTINKSKEEQLKTDAVLSFSDSDDEPLIKKIKTVQTSETVKTVSRTPVCQSQEVLLSPVKQEPIEPKCDIKSSKLRSTRSSRGRDAASERSEGQRRRKTSVDVSIYNRFSEPSPSLSEKIADAAGDPLDPPADLDDLTSMSDGVEALDALAGEMSEVMSGRLSFGSAQEIQSLMTSEFSGGFDDAVTGTMLLGSRDGTGASLETGLNLIKREDGPSKADAMTNTSEDDINFLCGPFGPYSPLLPEEVSVGTQTVTPPLSQKSKPSGKVPVPGVEQPKQKPAVRTQKDKEMQKRRLDLIEELKKLKLTLSDRKTFPRDDEPASLVVAPTYRPSLEEFKDPVEYISKIKEEAEKFGICKIVPPAGFKPECKAMDDMRFTAHNQYIHRVLSRWGPNVQHTECIKRCFRNQGITDDSPPLIGGIELDLSHLYHTVQSFGGIQQVIEKKKWQRVADAMHIPRAAQDRVSKVDDAYCKYVLPYDLLSMEEKERIEAEVLADYEKQLNRENASDQQADDDDDDEFTNECVTKGRSMSLSVFSRIARNTMSMWYKQAPSPEEVEKDYWNLVTEQKRHVVSHAGNIDSSVHGSGFPTNRLMPFSKHPWNLKVFTNNLGTILRCMGQVSGVTIPTLHLSMLFTTGCWYRDPHCLPWIEYLHSGANKIWYSVPAQSSERFHSAMTDIMPEVCKDTVIWLPSDCAMVPPPMLVGSGCPLSRTIQQKGEFVIIFPGAYTSTIACGFSVSESVYFATREWLLTASEHFQHIKESCEPPTFSLEKLLLGIATDLKETLETCERILPLLKRLCENEKKYRAQLTLMGLKAFERLPHVEVQEKKKPKRRPYMDEDDRECEVCRTRCYVSMVVNSQDDTFYCLEHAVQQLQGKNPKSWTLVYSYDMDELRSIYQKLENHIKQELENSSKTDVNSKKKSTKKK